MDKHDKQLMSTYAPEQAELTPSKAFAKTQLTKQWRFFIASSCTCSMDCELSNEHNMNNLSRKGHSRLSDVFIYKCLAGMSVWGDIDKGHVLRIATRTLWNINTMLTEMDYKGMVTISVYDNIT